MDLDFGRLKTELSVFPQRPTAIFYPSEDRSAFGSRLAELVDRLEQEAGIVVEIRRGPVPRVILRPGLTLTSSDGRSIQYMAVPEGPEAPPFLEALKGLARDTAGDSENRILELDGIERPAGLKVFIGAACPHCPGAVREANRLALNSPLITTTIIDAQQFSELAGRFGVQAVPQTVIDEGLSITGVVRAADLVEKIRRRGQKGYEEEQFCSLVETNRILEAVQQIRNGPGVVSFLSAWRKSTTSSRVGLLLTAEEALGEDPAALDSILMDLLNVLQSDDAALRGDTADLLGRIGHPAAREALEALRNDPQPDVAEIATEAIQEIETAGRGGRGNLA